MVNTIPMSLVDLSGAFSLNLVNCLAAAWFLSVGYLFYKNVNSRVGRTTCQTASVSATLLEPSERSVMRG